MITARKRIKILIAFVLAITTAGFAETQHPDVSVRYAYVPKHRLAEAVGSIESALAIEQQWRTAAIDTDGLQPYPMNLSPDYSIVLFIKCPALFALWGQLSIPAAQPKYPRLLNISLSPGYEGTYVIDGGGLYLVHGIPPEPKPYTWIEFHTK